MTTRLENRLQRLEATAEHRRHVSFAPEVAAAAYAAMLAGDDRFPMQDLPRGVPRIHAGMPVFEAADAWRRTIEVRV